MTEVKSEIGRPAQTGPVEDPVFNPLDGAVLRDPYPVYRAMREHYPVYWHRTLRSWMLTRYDDCLSVLRDSTLFTADFRRIGIATPPALLSLQTLDPPDQTPLRHLGLNAVKAQTIAAVERSARRRSEQLLASMAGRATVDFISDIADPFTLSGITELLGVPAPPNDDIFARFNDDLDHSMDSGLAPEGETAGIQAREHFNTLVEDWLADPPDEGVLGYIAAHLDGLDHDHEVLVNSLRAFFHAGFEVPSRLLGNAVWALLSHPCSLALLSDEARMDAAVEELIRFAGPVHALSRACTEDTVIGDTKISGGDVVVVLLAAADRDPAQFSAPDSLQLDRSPNAHLGFGRGAHSCLGLNIARAEARAMISTLAQHYPHMRAVGDPVPRRNATLRGLAELTVTLRG